MVALRMKLEMVAPVKVVFLKRLKSMNGTAWRRSHPMKRASPTAATTTRPRVMTLVQPSCLPKMRTIIMASTVIMKITSPTMSNLRCVRSSTLLSGVPRMSTTAMTVSTAPDNLVTSTAAAG